MGVGQSLKADLRQADRTGVRGNTPRTDKVQRMSVESARIEAGNLRANRNTSIGSLYDLPGLAIPNGRDAAGQPTSFLLSAPSGADTQLLRAGMAAESTIRSDIE